VLYEKEQMMLKVDSSQFLNPERDNSAYEAFIDELRLEKWMVQPVPLNPNDTLVSGLVAKILNVVKSRGYDTFFHERERFITGGAICQIAFEREWNADVDIFMPCMNEEEEKREKVILHSQEIDAIYKRLDDTGLKDVSITSVLRRFDLSICQVGVLISPGCSVVPVVYATPLFQCSLYFGFCAIQVSDITCQYADGYIDPGRWLEDAFKIHLLCHRNFGRPRSLADFVSCEACIWRGQDNIYHPDSHYIRWRERVEKYRVRFPESKFHYFCERRERKNLKRLKIF
jgi:hypothetical protein